MKIGNCKIENSKRGFTLVEIIVALGIFVTTVTIALGSLLNLYNANNKSQSLASVINNLNYSIENMAKTIRFATQYHCGETDDYTTPEPRDCVPAGAGDTFLAIKDQNSNVIFYKFFNDKLQTSVDLGLTYTPITSAEVTIEHARFYVYDTLPGDTAQPNVLLIIRGYAGNKPSNESRFDIQTTVSQRKLDLLEL